MSFGPQHYVPVLKIKRGEKEALRRISGPLRTRIVPLMEIVDRRDKPIAQHLVTAFKGLADSLQLYTQCFLDVRELEPDGPPAAELVFERAANAGIPFVPVTGISRTADVAAALQHRARGIALRVTRLEFEAGNLPSRIDAFIGHHGLEPSGTDLIVDLGPVEDLIVPGIAALTDAFMEAVPYHQQWRSFTVSGCAFPLSMGGVDRHSHEFVDRGEWIAWRTGLHARSATIPRLPTFSDCVIQHPSGVEGFDPRIMQVSAAIRYALADQWLLIKGESTRSVLPSEQFPVLATRLVYGHLRPHFAGVGHCAGCLAMKNAADGMLGYGSAEAWRRLGTIHHISTVMDGLDLMAWP